MNERSQWHRLVAVAAELGLAYGTTLRLVLTGQLRGEQRGGKWYVDPDSVRGFQEASSGAPCSQSSASLNQLSSKPKNISPSSGGSDGRHRQED